jgi:fatty acid desaturase
MKQNKVSIIAAISILLLIALGFFWPEGLVWLFIFLATLVFYSLCIFLPKIVLISSTPDISKQEIERILFQNDYNLSWTFGFIPFYPGPLGLFWDKENIPLKKEEKKS